MTARQLANRTATVALHTWFGVGIGGAVAIVAMVIGTGGHIASMIIGAAIAGTAFGLLKSMHLTLKAAAVEAVTQLSTDKIDDDHEVRKQ